MIRAGAGRLEISGDLVGMSVPDEYDAAVVAAVKKFQSRHGLPPTGIIDARVTIEAMNIPASVRLAQLQANLKRLQTLAPAAANRYVAVNIPSAQVEAVNSGQVVQRHAAVVGKPERATPELSSKIIEVNFNPYWYVPKSIIYKDLVPKAQEFARRNQDVLAACGSRPSTPPAIRSTPARSIGSARKFTTISSANFPGTRTRSVS